jgi:hypothetical protein
MRRHGRQAVPVVVFYLLSDPERPSKCYVHLNWTIYIPGLLLVHKMILTDNASKNKYNQRDENQAEGNQQLSL